MEEIKEKKRIIIASPTVDLLCSIRATHRVDNKKCMVACTNDDDSYHTNASWYRSISCSNFFGLQPGYFQ
jgi:hypothetical protein